MLIPVNVEAPDTLMSLETSRRVNVPIVPTKLVLFNLVIVPTPVMLIKAPPTFWNEISPETERYAPTESPPPTQTSLNVENPLTEEAQLTIMSLETSRRLIVPTPLILRFLPGTSSYTISSKT